MSNNIEGKVVVTHLRKSRIWRADVRRRQKQLWRKGPNQTIGFHPKEGASNGRRTTKPTATSAGSQHWHTNDGGGLGAERSIALADKLQAEIDSGRTLAYESTRGSEPQELQPLVIARLHAMPHKREDSRKGWNRGLLRGSLWHHTMRPRQKGVEPRPLKR
jgi:hypothetical protein